MTSRLSRVEKISILKKEKKHTVQKCYGEIEEQNFKVEWKTKLQFSNILAKIDDRI